MTGNCPGCRSTPAAFVPFETTTNGFTTCGIRCENCGTKVQ